ncbi:hypothetical protein KAI46_02365 [bacterium]|nr:hypothetical protein [bacterium]
MFEKTTKPHGTIVWIAPFYNRSGFAVGSRTTVTALDQAAIPVRIISTGDEEPGIDDCNLELIKKLENTPVTPPITTIIFHVPSKEWLKIKFPEPTLKILATAFDSSNADNKPPEQWRRILMEMDQIWLQTPNEINAFTKAGIPRNKLKQVNWPHHWKENNIIPSITYEGTGANKPFRFLSIAMFQPRRRWDSLTHI